MPPKLPPQKSPKRLITESGTGAEDEPKENAPEESPAIESVSNRELVNTSKYLIPKGENKDPPGQSFFKKIQKLRLALSHTQTSKVSPETTLLPSRKGLSTTALGQKISTQKTGLVPGLGKISKTSKKSGTTLNTARSTKTLNPLQKTPRPRPFKFFRSGDAENQHGRSLHTAFRNRRAKNGWIIVGVSLLLLILTILIAVAAIPRRKSGATTVKSQASTSPPTTTTTTPTAPPCGGRPTNPLVQAAGYCRCLVNMGQSSSCRSCCNTFGFFDTFGCEFACTISGIG